MSYKVSVIVPVYNIELFLDKCVDSILLQTLQEIEIILVDDGSTDSSAEKCDNYYNKYSNIKVIHQENSGTNMARVAGVIMAEGEYIGFVDGDDWIDSDMYEVLYNEANVTGADIVTSYIVREYANTGFHPLLKDSLEEGIYKTNDKEFINCILPGYKGQKTINGSLCNKLFKKDIIKKSLTTIPDNAKVWMEDTVVVFHALLNSTLVRVTSFCKYHHREWEGSATYRKNPKVFEDISRAYNSMLTIAKKSDYYNELYPQIVGFTMMSVLDGMRKAFDCEIETIPRFCLDLNDDIEIGAKIIIYGFGEVGKSVYRQMITEKKYQVVAVADRQVCDADIGVSVVHPTSIDEYEADYVVVAIKNKKIADEIISDLKEIGINKAILWKEPKSLFEYYKI